MRSTFTTGNDAVGGCQVSESAIEVHRDRAVLERPFEGERVILDDSVRMHRADSDEHGALAGARCPAHRT
jgi:hypothetical protein